MATDESEKVRNIVRSDGWDLAGDGWESEPQEPVPYRKMTREELRSALIRDGIIKRKKG